MSNFEQFLMALAFTIFFMGIGKIVITEVRDILTMRWVKRQIKRGNVKIIYSDIDLFENDEQDKTQQGFIL